MKITFLILTTILITLAVKAQTALPFEGPAAAAQRVPIESVTIHPLFRAEYSCSEHAEGELPYPGDDLGSDCAVYGGVDGRSKTGFPRFYRTDGAKNEDWYGWGEPVLAPFDGSVVKIYVNPVVNTPGMVGKPPASYVVFKREDGTHVLIAHVADVTVKEGETVTAGEPFAKMGNNGYGRLPHLHVGAFRDKTRLQIRFDLRAKAQIHKNE